jgi:hypothetical protein
VTDPEFPEPPTDPNANPSTNTPAQDSAATDGAATDGVAYGEGAGEELAAPIEERVNAALDICADVVDEVVPALVDRLDKLEQGVAPAAPGEKRSDYRFESYPPPHTPEDLAKQVERASQAWRRLAEWVDWMVGVYRLTMVIPACWPEHPAIVEELVSLRVSWVGAWNDAASPDAPAGWQRRLAEAKGRLNDGNWGVPRCEGSHDGTGLDQSENVRAWQAKPQHDTALLAARNRALGALPALHMAGTPHTDQSATGGRS